MLYLRFVLVVILLALSPKARRAMEERGAL